MTYYCTSAEDTATIDALNERINGELYGGFFKEKKKELIPIIMP